MTVTVTGARDGSGVAHAWPLIDRDQELEQISSLWANATCPAVAVIAPAGVGKSRLAREAVAAADRAGAMVCWVQARGARRRCRWPLAPSSFLLMLGRTISCCSCSGPPGPFGSTPRAARS